MGEDADLVGTVSFDGLTKITISVALGNACHVSQWFRYSSDPQKAQEPGEGSGDEKNKAFIPDCTVESFLPDYPISEYKYTHSVNYIKGDINNDKCIDIFDLIAVKKGLINGFSSKAAETAADADSSGSVSVNDAVLIQKYIHGSIISFSEVS